VAIQLFQMTRRLFSSVGVECWYFTNSTRHRATSSNLSKIHNLV